MEWIDTASPRARARVTGVVYLFYFVTAILGEVFLQQAGVSGLSPNGSNAGTLANNLQSHAGVYQLGVAIGLISTVLYVAVTTLFYLLFRPVSQTLALLALAFGLVAMAITAVGSIFELAPLSVLATSAGALNAEQIQMLALTWLKVGEQFSPVSLVFSGFFQIVTGYLIIRSRFLPWIFGVLIAMAGVGWLTFLAPPLSNALLTYLEVLGVLGEAPLLLWLLVMGVDSQRWNDKAAPATR
ncbi:MAG TPA: DUF4386 domain-containing protein [Candidatus Dormibacteraeota bacterium]|nr:DUF4386 domain-containing protein [Candidatus Dormibacteraeota bacterium]